MSSPERPILPAGRGAGRLLQRDYWAVLDRPRVSARGAARTMARHFEEFPPPDLVRFSRKGGKDTPLRPGSELTVDLPLAGPFGVRVVHRDALSLTIATLEGHPEAGRITFGVYPDLEGDLVVHIRSRARSGSQRFVTGFLAAGEPMQTNTWSGYIDRLAAVVAEGVRDVIHVETRRVEETRADRRAEGLEPTFRAMDRRGG